MTQGTEDTGTVQGELDGLSLTQALIDFEIANARVIDLTGRLLEAEAVAANLRGELAEMRSTYDALLATHESMKSSQAFRAATKVWAIRNALGI